MLQVWGQDWSAGPDQAYLHWPNSEWPGQTESSPGSSDPERSGKGIGMMWGEKPLTPVPGTSQTLPKALLDK